MNGWYEIGRLQDGVEKINVDDVPRPIDLHHVLAHSVVAKSAYENAMHLGYTTEQCYLAVILALAGTVDMYSEMAQKQAATADHPRVVDDGAGNKIAIL